MLEEDMQSFNNHLNDNKKNARAKINEAEEKTKAKNKLVAVIK